MKPLHHRKVLDTLEEGGLVHLTCEANGARLIRCNGWWVPWATLLGDVAQDVPPSTPVTCLECLAL